MNCYYLTAVISASAALLGVFVGGWMAALNGKKERRHALLMKKLEEFYGPFNGIRSRIRVKSELRPEISALLNKSWTQLIEQARPLGSDYMKEVSDNHAPEYDRMTEYNNNQLISELLPAYKELLALLISKMHLAEASTYEHLPALIRFIEVWDRWLNKTLPVEVLNELGHTEKSLYPLYEDVERQFVKLQESLNQE